METDTVTVRIPKALKDELRRRGIVISELVRKALEEELNRRQRAELEESAARLGELFSDIGVDAVTRSIREQRAQR
jgi:post-segregation antitoxin (ccd killing protein)